MAVPSSNLPGEDAYVSRAGLKLHHALAAFGVDPGGLVCADFGCNVGGFTDCLLKHGAASVIAVDTGYGALAWTLRNDPRVEVRERTNALHAEPPEGGVDLVVVDMGWTPQRLAVPAAMRWIGARPNGRIITLIKPHYELEAREKGLLSRGVLEEPDAERIALRTIEAMPGHGAKVLANTRSPISGGAGKKHAHGNAEYLALLAPLTI